MSEALEPEPVSRRRALSLLGLAGALGLAAPRILLTVSAAEAEAIPAAFDQADKPLPGEGGRARTSPEGDKPILSAETGTRRRRYRRKRVQERHEYRRKRRRKPSAPQQPASEDKPK
jgi:hypothetical protein